MHSQLGASWHLDVSKTHSIQANTPQFKKKNNEPKTEGVTMVRRD